EGSTSRAPTTGVPSKDRLHPASATRMARSAITRLTYPIFHRRADRGDKPRVLALQLGLLQCSRAAGAPSRQPRRGLIQTGFPSRVFAMRRSSPVYNSRSHHRDYLLETHTRFA